MKPARLRVSNARLLALVLGVLASLVGLAPPAAAVPPSNDDFDNAKVISSLPFTHTINTRDATRADDDPGCTLEGHTVWYRWKAPDTMRVKVDNAGTSFLSSASVYTGVRGSLTQVACDPYSSLSPPLEFEAVGGETYYLMVGSYGGGAGGRMELSVTRIPPPPNDDFAQSTTIPDLPFEGSVDVHGATTEPTDPDCFGGTRSVWFTFTATSAGRIRAHTFGSAYDTTLGAYTGSPGALTEVACNDNTRSSLAMVELDVVPSTTYHFMVSQSPSGGGGTEAKFTVYVIPPAPSNDDFDNATSIGPLPFTETLDTVGATTAPDDPFCYPVTDHTVWYAFTARADMRVQASTLGSTFDTVLSVYTGSRGSLSLIGCDDSALGYQSMVRFNAVSGETYFLMAGAGQQAVGEGGDLKVTVREVVPAPNDDFDDATVIPSFPFTDAVDSTAATTAVDDPGPSCAPMEKSVWYSFTAAERMRIDLSTVESVYDTRLAVFTGDRGNLQEVACNDNRDGGMAGIEFETIAGTTYYVMLGSWVGGPGGEWVLTATQLPLITSLELVASRKTILYKQSVTLTAHLEDFEFVSNPLVSIYRTPYGGSKTLVSTEELDSSGNVSVTVTPNKNTTFVAEWSGDDRFAPATSSLVRVKVRVIVKIKLSGHYGTSGGYKLYHAGDDVIWTGTVSPNHRGKRLLFQLQVRRGGGWDGIFQGSFRLGSKSFVRVRLAGVPAGFALRARNVFRADQDHLGNRSPFAYFRTTA